MLILKSQHSKQPHKKAKKENRVIKNIILCSFLITGFAVYAEPSNTMTQKISFNYQNEDLVNVINYIASQKNINVILPMRPDDKINAKLSWHLDKKVTLTEAWNLLGTILAMAGYSIF